MKKVKLFFILLSFLATNAFCQSYISSGDVSGTWGVNGTPYYIQGDITVPDDSTLTIEPGVSVVFEGYYVLNVQGRLLAVGTETEMISFTINDTTGFYNPDNTAGGWNGIQFIDTQLDNDTSKIVYCSIKYGKAVGSGAPDNSGGAIYIGNFNKVIISDCIISNNSSGGSNSPSGGGICLFSSSITLLNNEISYNNAWDGGGIQIWESDPVFKNNSILFNRAEEGGGGIWIGGLSNCAFNNDIISNNLSGNNGGGIVCWQTSKSVLDSVKFNDNSAYNGGAIAIFDCELQLNDCDIKNNTSDWIGGGINSYGSTVGINSSYFEGNNAFLFGGAMGIYYSDLTIQNSSLVNNKADTLGGGIHSDYTNINISNTLFETDTSGIAGGAIFTWHCDLTINNCEYNDNYSANGGAISSDSSSVIITGTDFARNSSAWGGAILNNTSELHLNDCQFTANNSGNGGAIFITYSNAELKKTSIVQNTSGWGGGIDALNTSMKIDSCQFSENVVTSNGGGIRCLVDTVFYVKPYDLEISNSVFSKNSAATRGAAEIEQMNIEDTLLSIKIDKCDFIDNIANRVGAMRIRYVKDLQLSNSKITGNTASQNTAACTFNQSTKGYVYNCLFANNYAGLGTSGAAGVSVGSNIDFMNCTFVNNSSSSGGGIHLRQGGTATVTNSILWGNYPDQISLLAVTDTTDCTLYLNYNDIQYGIDSVHINDTISVSNWGLGNIDADPLLADTTNGDYHLLDASPCIEKGIDTIKIAGVWYYSPLEDIENNSRPYPAGTMPDIGAYESQYTVGIDGNNSLLPNKYELYQNYPNPFNPATKIKYTLIRLSKVQIIIYDILGRKIRTLVNEEKPAGIYEVNWQAANLPSGVYFYQLRAGTYVQTKKMILLK